MILYEDACVIVVSALRCVSGEMSRVLVVARGAGEKKADACMSLRRYG